MMAFKNGPLPRTPQNALTRVPTDMPSEHLTCLANEQKSIHMQALNAPNNYAPDLNNYNYLPEAKDHHNWPTAVHRAQQARSMDSSTGTKAHIAAHLLSLAHPPERAADIFKDKVKLRPLHLKPGEGQTPDARDYRRKVRIQAEERKKRKRKPQPLSAKEKRETGLHQIPKEQQKYAIFEPLNRLWIGYLHEVLGPGRPVTGVAAAKLASADYHGALVEVSRSRCASRVGVRGIVVKDTKYTFEVITQVNEIKVLPKEHTVFRFEVPEGPPVTQQKEDTMDVDSEPKKVVKNLVFELHGEQFQHRAVDRANKKFKQHFLPDI